MDSILVGNGVNIQFGGKDYTNASIIRRAINNVLSGNFLKGVYPHEVVRYVYELKKIFPEVLEGKFDRYVYADFEKKALSSLQQRYNKGQMYNVSQIGIEDYFLLHDLLCAEYDIHNPESYHIREILKRFFLDSIYNQGKIRKNYQLFPQSFNNFLKKNDKIFTTNYDQNIENASDREVFHLHGSFNTLDEVYDTNSFRNKISDQPGKGFEINGNNRHLYSNALLAYGGYLKNWFMKQHKRTNNALSSFSEAYKTDSNLKNDMEKWKDSSNYILSNLYEGIKLKTENPSLNFEENYHLDKLNTISETLSILGLSPNNDSHLFDTINRNDEIEKIKYYCYNKNEAQTAKSIFSDKNVFILDVNKLWEKLF
jgi:hypothetical protein